VAKVESKVERGENETYEKTCKTRQSVCKGDLYSGRVRRQREKDGFWMVHRRSGSRGARKSVAPTLRRARSAGFGSDLPPHQFWVTSQTRVGGGAMSSRITAIQHGLPKGPPEVPGPDVLSLDR